MEGGPLAMKSIGLALKAETSLLQQCDAPPDPTASLSVAGPATRCVRGLRWGALVGLIGLAGCTQSSNSGFSFAAQSGQYDSDLAAAGKSRAEFANGSVILVAPPGHCIDTSMLRQDAEGGFALLPRCNLLQGSSWFGRNRAAVITATIGKATNPGAPRTADIARTAQGAKLLYYDDKGVLPLVRLNWPGHSTAGGSGASPEHWRGAFVLNDHLVLLALYAPEGSNLLGRVGADLLTEMTLRSLKASTATIGAATIDTGANLPPSAPAAAAKPDTDLRPKTRPEARNANSQRHSSEKPAVSGEKLSWRERIAGLFQ